jgi:tagatose-6-phosphate ketose/aldose isomerase
MNVSPVPDGPDGLSDWLEELSGAREWGPLLSAPPGERESRGYGNTLREILQQPLTWEGTARLIGENRAVLERALRDSGVSDGEGSLFLTGSGSSAYVGECVALPLQAALGVPVHALSAGLLLTHQNVLISQNRPCLLVSIARSGNSPESCAVVDHLLGTKKPCRHLILTNNRGGRLATSYEKEPRVTRLVLDESTHDRSLVMTSSFTNLVLGARSLAFVCAPRLFHDLVRSLAVIARGLLAAESAPVADLARRPFRSALFLGTGSRYGSAREASLKMMELSGGSVSTSAETFLGLRHGPMSGIKDDTLVVCFLSSDRVARAYEVDVLHELRRKKLGLSRLVVGGGIPKELLESEDVAVECPGLASLGDFEASIIDVLVAQMLAFFRGLSLGIHPDSPSPNQVISRVVEKFDIHH